jgi:hypothetical protein
MKFRLQRSDFVAIGVPLAVIIFVTLLSSPQGNNPPVPRDSKHRGFRLEMREKGAGCACFLAPRAVK